MLATTVTMIQLRLMPSASGPPIPAHLLPQGLFPGPTNLCITTGGYLGADAERLYQEMGHFGQDKLLGPGAGGTGPLRRIRTPSWRTPMSTMTGRTALCPVELLRELLLGSTPCAGGGERLLQRHTNITSARFLVFGVKDPIHANSSVKTPCCSTCCPASTISSSPRETVGRPWMSSTSGCPT